MIAAPLPRISSKLRLKSPIFARLWFRGILWRLSTKLKIVSVASSPNMRWSSPVIAPKQILSLSRKSLPVKVFLCAWIRCKNAWSFNLTCSMLYAHVAEMGTWIFFRGIFHIQATLQPYHFLWNDQRFWWHPLMRKALQNHYLDFRQGCFWLVPKFYRREILHLGYKVGWGHNSQFFWVVNF